MEREETNIFKMIAGITLEREDLDILKMVAGGAVATVVAIPAVLYAGYEGNSAAGLAALCSIPGDFLTLAYLKRPSRFRGHARTLDCMK